MQTRSYGPNGPSVSPIGLGGAFLTDRSFADGVATVHRALDLGISYFDTSPMYCQGASQAVLGEALAGKDDVLIATKLGYFADPTRFQSRIALLTQFEENLRLLRRKSVGTLQAHEADQHCWWSDDTSHTGRLDPSRDYDFDNAPVLQVFRELKEQDRCRFYGISGNTADHMGRVLDHTTLDTFLLAFNYDLLRRGARAVLPRAEKRGIVRLVGAIFQRGLSHPQPELLDHPPAWMTDELQANYRQLYALQRESGMTLATLGVRYMVAQPETDVIIIGAGTPDEIEECVRAAEAGPLPTDLYQQIEALGLNDTPV
ncbi:MAG: aldo/keto reductase [Candidatus Latescibacterota bacterium]|jgi:aryl-alcohol dehydrogenase-like predicted oxidoreductase